MKISMCSEFRLLKNVDGMFETMKHDKIDGVSVGGYSFVIDGKNIPFDWDACSGGRVGEDVLSFETGKGFAFNDYEIPDYWDDEYAKMGISRDDLTAEFLASATAIAEFFVYFEDKDVPSEVECSAGAIEDNKDENTLYRVELLKVSFVNLETGEEYEVKKEVLEAYNKGVQLEKIRPSLETLIAEGSVKDLEGLNEKCVGRDNVR